MTEPTSYQTAILIALQRKPPGSVYQGTAHDRPARRRLKAAIEKRRQARLNDITARSQFARRTA